MSEKVTAERIAEIRNDLALIQPDDEYVRRNRYPHGGGRMSRETPEGDRSLILDAYEEGDREFYFKAASFVRDLLLALDAAQAERDEAQRVEERMCGERDAAEEAADRLAYAIAPIEAIGEHSNLNDPWQNALDEIESIKERAQAWGLLNQMRESDQKKVAAAESARAAAEAEVTRLRAQMTWQPIETLPDEMKDGRDLIVWDGNGAFVAFCSASDGAWHNLSDMCLKFSTRAKDVEYEWLPMRPAPTHWQPLPAPPSEETR